MVAESRGLLRAGLAGLLSGGNYGRVHQAATLDAALSVLRPGADGVLLLDMDLLGATGAAGLRVVRRTAGSIRIVVLGAREDRDEILACLAAGAHGFVARSAEFAELERAIAAVLAGGMHVPAGLSGEGVDAAAETRARDGAGPRPLTGRQQDVLRLLAEGRSTKDIARTLDLAVSTIKVHLAAVYRTVGARNRVEALCRAGLLPPLRPGGVATASLAQAA